MTGDSDHIETQIGWYEAQYWADVLAIRPERLVETRSRVSEEVRRVHKRHLDVPYGADQRHRFDVFLPHGNGGPWPTLIFIHGGYWQLGHKNEQAFLAPAWNERGVAVVTLGYRLLPQASLKDIVGDIQAAMEHISEERSELNLDTDRSVVAGLSAGAHLASMYITGKNAFQPRGAILMSGVYDLVPLLQATPGRLLENAMDEALHEISPLGRMAPTDCDCLVAWGESETTVFHSQSQLLRAYWQNRGLTTTNVTVNDANHYTILESLRGDSESEIAAFVGQKLL